MYNHTKVYPPQNNFTGVLQYLNLCRDLVFFFFLTKRFINYTHTDNKEMSWCSFYYIKGLPTYKWLDKWLPSIPYFLFTQLIEVELVCWFLIYGLYVLLVLLVLRSKLHFPLQHWCWLLYDTWASPSLQFFSYNSGNKHKALTQGCCPRCYWGCHKRQMFGPHWLNAGVLPEICFHLLYKLQMWGI